MNIVNVSNFSGKNLQLCTTLGASVHWQEELWHAAIHSTDQRHGHTHAITR